MCSRLTLWQLMSFEPSLDKLQRAVTLIVLPPDSLAHLVDVFLLGSWGVITAVGISGLTAVEHLGCQYLSSTL